MLLFSWLREIMVGDIGSLGRVDSGIEKGGVGCRIGHGKLAG
jgi:hypothetical protein